MDFEKAAPDGAAFLLWLQFRMAPKQKNRSSGIFSGSAALSVAL